MNKTIEQYMRFIQNTPWHNMLDNTEFIVSETDRDLLSYYALKLFDIDNLSELCILSLCSTPEEKIHYTNIRNYKSAVHRNESKAGFEEIINKFKVLVYRLVFEYIKTTNGMESTTYYNTSDDKTKYRRHYVGTPKAGVLLHSCACCDQFFLTADTPVDNERFINNVTVLKRTETPICPCCVKDLKDTIEQENELMNDLLDSLAGVVSVPMIVHHVSVAPPDSAECDNPTEHKIAGKRLLEKKSNPDQMEEGK